MIKCHLSRIMGERKLKIADVARDLSINRGTISRLYHEDFSKIDKEVINQLCQYFECQVGDLFQYIED